jgi:hypothetical protein
MHLKSYFEDGDEEINNKNKNLEYQKASDSSSSSEEEDDPLDSFMAGIEVFITFLYLYI